MTRTSTTAHRREHAQLLIEAFCRRFGEWAPAYRLLAQHAALPLILTPELVSYLRNHFLRGQAPWVAESDLLLSELCREVAYEQYVMDQAVRAVLIEELRRDPALGKARMAEVARLLMGYVRSLARTDHPLPSHELQAQQWAAMVYLDDKRESVARQIAAAFSGVLKPGGAGGVDRAELARLANLTQTLAPELAAYRELVSYGRNVARLLGDVTGKATKELDRTGLLDASVQVLDVNLPALRGVVPEPRAVNEVAEIARYPELEQALAEGRVCAFVGTGLSVGAGLPSWYELITELAASISYKLPPPEWTTSDELLDAAQAYVNRQGLHSLISHLKGRLDTTGVQPTAAHRALARLPISVVFTTNFDDLLERAFRDAGKRVEVVVHDGDVSFVHHGPDTVTIVKLCGDLDQPETIVLTWQHYKSYFYQRPQMLKLLEAELATANVLYLGWNGSDPYFKLVFDNLLSQLGEMMRPGYAVMFDVTDSQRAKLRRKQIRLIELPVGNRVAELATWLVTLTPGPRVLIVDDNIEACQRLAKIIRGLGCVTSEAVTNAQALSLLTDAQPRFDLVTSDALRRQERAGESGYVGLELIRTINQRFPQLRVVLISRDEPEILTRLAPNLQVAALLNKELSDDQLAETFRRVLNGENLPNPWTLSANRGTPASIINTGNSWAILVGVNTYEDVQHFGRLSFCVNDAEAIRDQLIAGGFDPTHIHLLTDNTEARPTRANILTHLKLVADAAEPDDLLLFYYGGHGVEAGGESYLVASDGRYLLWDDTAIPLARIKQIMRATRARAKVMILDASHAGAHIGQRKSQLMTPEFIQRVFEGSEGLAILASCRQDQRSYDWTVRQQSVFTSYLLEALAGNADLEGKGFVTLFDTSRYVTDGVKRWAAERNVSQAPTLEYNLTGDILLTRHAASRRASQTGSGLAPRVVHTEPADGETDVNPAIEKLVITFDRPMSGDSWSITASGGLNTTELVPELSENRTTFVFARKTPTSLPGNAKITCTINPAEPSGPGFVDSDGRRAEMYIFSFTTGMNIPSMGPLPNPYIVESVVSGTAFVDREDILSLLEDLCRGTEHQAPVLLYGQPGIGKTWILREFLRRSQTRAIVTYLNMHRIGMVDSTGELLDNLAMNLYEALAVGGAEQTLKEPREKDFANGNPFIAFNRFMEQMDSARGGRQVIIVIDEYEIMWQLIAEAKVEAELLSYWRSLIQANPWFTFVWAGRNPIQDMERAESYWFGSPLWNIFRSVHVDYLSYAATEQLITRLASDLRLEYSTEAVREIYALSNGHPYLTQLLCTVLVHLPNIQARRNILRSDVNAAVNDPGLLQRIDFYFDALWRQAAGDTNSGQAEVLQAIARSEMPMDLSAIANATRLSADAARRALETLELRDVLLRDEANRWRYAVELMRRWVARLST